MEHGQLELRKEMINHVKMQRRGRSVWPAAGVYPLPTPTSTTTHHSVSEQVCNYLKKQVSAPRRGSLSLAEREGGGGEGAACQLAHKVLTSSGIPTLWWLVRRWVGQASV